MFNCSTLPLTVAPAPGESAMSLASRLARRNGVPRLVTFCSDVGLDYNTLMIGAEPEVLRLAQLAGCDPEPLRFWTPRLIRDGVFRLGREELKFTCLSRSTARACPQCVQEARQKLGSAGPAHLGIWQLASIRTCHHHGCLLVDMSAVKDTGDVFDYARRLDHIVAETSQPISEDNMPLEKWLLDRLEFGARDSWLDSLPVHVATQTCENSGVLIAFGPNIRRDNVTPEQWLVAGKAGFEILQTGPEAFRQSLKSIQMQTAVDKPQYRARYRFFYNWIRNKDEDPAFDVIRDLVRDFIWSNYPVAEGAQVLGKLCPVQKVHTPETAAKVYGVSAWKIRKRLIALGCARQGEGQAEAILQDYVSARVMARVARDIQNLQTAKQVGETLKIKPSTLLLLAKANILKIEMTLGTKAPYYDGRKVAAFMASLEGLVQINAPVPDDAMPFVKASSHSNCSLENLIRVILKHKLPLYADRLEKLGFHDFRISLADFKDATSQLAGPGCSLTEAAKMIGVDTETVRALLKFGYLAEAPANTSETYHRHRIISTASVHEFTRQYIALTTLAKLYTRDAASFCKELYAQGVTPLSLGRKTRRIFARTDAIL